MNRLLKLTKLFIFGALALFKNAEGLSDVPNGFSVGGVITFQNYGTNKAQITHTVSQPFEIKVVGASWHLKLPYANGTAHEFFCDGTNTMEFFIDKKFDNISMPVVLTHDGFPSIGSWADTVWLAYASAKNLSEGKQVPATWGDSRNDPRNFAFETVVTQLEGIYRIPRKVTYITSERKAREALKNPAVKIEGISPQTEKSRRQQLAQYRDGFIAGEYNLIASTNLGSLNIPVEFAMDVFVNKNTRTGTNSVSYLGTATNIQLLTAPLEWPNIKNESGKFSIVDRRFQSYRQGVDSIQYSATSSIPKSISDPGLLSMFEEKKASAPFIRLSIIQEYSSQVLIFLLAMAPIAAYLIGERIKQNKIKQNKTTK